MKKITFRPCLVVLSGTPLTGKTFLAERLVKISNFKMIDVDVARNRLDGSRRKDKRIKMLNPRAELAVMIKAYIEMCKQAEKSVNKNIPAIITGTFSKAEFKRPLQGLISSLKKKRIPVKVFLLTISDKEALKRIRKRKKEKSLSNIISFDKYNWAKGIFSKIKFAPVIKIDASDRNYIKKTINNLEKLKI